VTTVIVHELYRVDHKPRMEGHSKRDCEMGSSTGTQGPPLSPERWFMAIVSNFILLAKYEDARVMIGLRPWLRIYSIVVPVAKVKAGKPRRKAKW